MIVVDDDYTVHVRAPDAMDGPPRPWSVRAARHGDTKPLAIAEHFDLEHACAEVFHAIRMDIARRMERGIQAGVCDATHDGAGGDEHRGATSFDELTDAQITRLVDRVDELLRDHPQAQAHTQRNAAGQFVFSPATCPLCREVAELELQAWADAITASGATA